MWPKSLKEKWQKDKSALLRHCREENVTKLHKYSHPKSHLWFSFMYNFLKNKAFSLKTFHAMIFSFSRGHLFTFWKNLSNICSRALAFREERSGGSTRQYSCPWKLLTHCNFRSLNGKENQWLLHMPRQERQLCKVIEPKWKRICMRPWVFLLTCDTLCKPLPNTTCQALRLAPVSLVKGGLWIPWDRCWGPAVQPQCSLRPAWIWTALCPLTAPRPLTFRHGPDAWVSPAAPEVGGWPPTQPGKVLRAGHNTGQSLSCPEPSTSISIECLCNLSLTLSYFIIFFLQNLISDIKVF